MVLCASASDQRRLAAQLELLDPLHRPSLLDALNDLDALKEDHKFEVVGGRLNQNDLQSSTLLDLWPTIADRTCTGARLRLLLSESELGPASALLEHSQGALPPETAEALQGLQQLEAQWLSQRSEREALVQQLEASGWAIESTNWQESSSLRLDQTLMSRWLGSERPYRVAVERQTCSNPTALAILKKELTQRLGQQLPIRLQHWRIDGLRQ